MKTLDKNMELYDMVKVSHYRSEEYMYDRICEIINQETGLRGKTLHDTISLLANRNDICKPINNRRPTTTIIKNSLKKICNDNDAISRCINALDKLYLYVGIWTFYICPYETFNRVCVSDRDISSCFRPEGSNRRHYEFLLGLDGYAMTQYLYMESETGQIARAIMLSGKDAVFICNLYGTKITSLSDIAPLVSRAIGMYKNWNDYVNYDTVYTDMPFYLNNNTALVIYNVKNIFSANVALENIKLETYGKCQNCGDKISLHKAHAVEVRGKGHVLCIDCADELGTHCDGCGRSIDPDNVYNFEDYTYCESCFYEIAFYCYHCGEAYHIDDSYLGADDHYYCRDCFSDRFTTCVSCDTVLYRESDSCYYDEDGEPYCEECFYDKYTYCDECGRLIYISEAHELSSGTYCEDCASDYLDEEE